MWLLNPYWYTGQYSAPASFYMDQVIAADVAAGNSLGLEDATKAAYAKFIDDLIVDGLLGVTGGTISQASSVIKALPILAGARTREGSLVPLVGTAPTAFGTVGGWNYGRKTGLQGNGTNNYLNSNRAGNAEGQNNAHQSVYITAAQPSGSVGSYIGNGFGAPGATSIISVRTGTDNNIAFRNRTANAATITGQGSATGFAGSSRSLPGSYTSRVAGSTATQSVASETPNAQNYFVFARSDGSGVANSFSSARLSFYSIGENLNLALLDSRVTALMNAFAAAIP